MKKHKIKTITNREYSGRQRNWVDVKTTTQEEINNFFRTKEINQFLERYGDDSTDINKFVTWNQAKQIYLASDKWVLSKLAFSQFSKVFKRFIEIV